MDVRRESDLGQGLGILASIDPNVPLLPIPTRLHPQLSITDSLDLVISAPIAEPRWTDGMVLGVLIPGRIRSTDQS
jgi:hypothetical protein